MPLILAQVTHTGIFLNHCTWIDVKFQGRRDGFNPNGSKGGVGFCGFHLPKAKGYKPRKPLAEYKQFGEQGIAPGVWVKCEIAEDQSVIKVFPANGDAPKPRKKK